MTRIKMSFTKISGRIRQVFSRYPMTLILIFAASVIAAFFIDRNDAFVEKGLLFTVLWGAGTYFSETFFADRKALKYGIAILAGAIAAGLVIMNSSGTELTEALTHRLIITYSLTVLMCGIFRNYRDSGLAFNEYCIRAVYQQAQLAVICGIIAVGLALVLGVFSFLILDSDGISLIFRTEFLVLGCLAGFTVLYAQLSGDQTVPGFFKWMIRIMLCLVTAAFVIIYGYILKIIITRIVPSNEIFRILAGLFLIGLPVWTTAGSFEAHSRLGKIGKALPFVFIPFVLLQGYAIGTRIAVFGITPMRYLGLALMLFEMIYIAIYALRRETVGVMLPVIAVLTAISLLIPGINMYSVSVRSQRAILDRFSGKDLTSLSDEDLALLTGSYDYLSGNTEGKALLSDLDPAVVSAAESGGRGFGDLLNQNTLIMQTYPLQNEDIGRYDRLTLVHMDAYNARALDSEPFDPGTVSFFDADGETVLTADLRQFIAACEEAENRGNGIYPDRIESEDGSVLLCLSLLLETGADGSVIRLDLEGVLLKKDL